MLEYDAGRVQKEALRAYQRQLASMAFPDVKNEVMETSIGQD